MGIDDRYNRFAAVVPSDTLDFVTPGPRAIYVGGAGNVQAVNGDNTLVVFTAVPVGTVLRIAPRRINAALTTATLLVALYDT